MSTSQKTKSKSSVKVVIPARFDSKRFPGKILAPILDKPMIQHVYERAVQSDADEVIVATDTDEIRKECEAFGATVVMTGKFHTSGTDRIREVAEELGWSNSTPIVNVQGDSPLIAPSSINQVASYLKDNRMATLAVPITDPEEFFNRNVVKVVMDAMNNALYFSRSPIPNQTVTDKVDAYRHLGIYGYTVATLVQLTGCPPVWTERLECLEQLRALQLGIKIKVGLAKEPHLQDVDTPDDIEIVERILSQ